MPFQKQLMVNLIQIQLLIAQCQNMYSVHVTEHVLAEIINSANYSAFLLNSSCGFSDKFKRVHLKARLWLKYKLMLKESLTQKNNAQCTLSG